MEHIKYEIEGAIATLTVNRPHALNALNSAVFNELHRFLQEIALEHRLRAVILTGAGDKAFIAGADIKEMQSLTNIQIKDFCALGQGVANTLETAPYVTIAAVNGYALGGGLEMALACDFIYASDKAVMGMPEATLGLIPGFGGTQRLTDAVGARRAKEIILSAQTFSAQTAKEIGIVNKIHPSELLLEQCKAIAREIAKHSSKATTGAKNAINGGRGIRFSEALELERNIFAACFDTPERHKATEAFLNKKG